MVLRDVGGEEEATDEAAVDEDGDGDGDGDGDVDEDAGKGEQDGLGTVDNKNNVVNTMTVLGGPRSHLVCGKTPAPHAFALRQ